MINNSLYRPQPAVFFHTMVKSFHDHEQIPSETGKLRTNDNITRMNTFQEESKLTLIIMLCPAYGFLNPSVNVYTLLLTELVDFKLLIFNSLFVAADSYVL